MAIRPYRPGRSRIARQIDRHARLQAMRREGGGELADSLESLGRALDQGPGAGGVAHGVDRAAAGDGETRERWWEK